jgi:hypothetical protein
VTFLTKWQFSQPVSIFPSTDFLADDPKKGRKPTEDMALQALALQLSAGFTERRGIHVVKSLNRWVIGWLARSVHLTRC